MPLWGPSGWYSGRYSGRAASGRWPVAPDPAGRAACRHHAGARSLRDMAGTHSSSPQRPQSPFLRRPNRFLGVRQRRRFRATSWSRRGCEGGSATDSTIRHRNASLFTSPGSSQCSASPTWVFTEKEKRDRGESVVSWPAIATPGTSFRPSFVTRHGATRCVRARRAKVPAREAELSRG